MQNKNIKKILLIVSILSLVMLGGAYAGYHKYVAVRQARLLKQARRYIARADTARAQLCLRNALYHNPKDLEACRLMAQVAEATSSPKAVLWRSKVMELNPHSLEDRLALAQIAVVMHDYAAAAKALEGVDATGRETASFHNLAAALALELHHPAEAETHFLEASRLDPQDPTPQLNLAVVRLHGTNAPELAEARTVLQRLAANQTNSALRCQALSELTVDARRRKETNTELALSKQLIQETNSPFKYWMLRLTVLWETKNEEFKSALAQCQHEAATNQSEISELATWEMNHNSTGDALAWLHSLPMNTQTNQPTPVLIANCLMALKDWGGLYGCLEKQRWAELEYLRHAFMCRALRGQELSDSAKAEWEQALQAAKDQERAIVALQALAAGWNWTKEKEELLWAIVNRYPQEKWATEDLIQALYLGGRTRSLMQLFTKELQRTPSDLIAKNNLAMTAILLDAQELKPYDLARVVYQQAPTNSFFATTYAFSLYMQGKSADALKVMQQIQPQNLEIPTTAGYYGVILKANGNAASAEIYLEKASKARLLPEERKLFAQAKVGT
jgi:Flp pilus assembly protein TadD